MDRATWDQHWRAGKIAFHLHEVHPRLRRHAPALLPPAVPTGAQSRVLVPLCGKSHDLAWLAGLGHEVVGVEFVEHGARAFFSERSWLPEELRLGPHQALRAGGVTIVVADIFQVHAAELGHFTAIFDRAALVAIEPPQQRAYLEKLRSLAADDARLLLVNIEHDMQGGPPFSLSPAELQQQAAGLFTLRGLEEEDLLAAEPRFRERGATFMRESAWAGRASSSVARAGDPQPL